MAKSIEKLEARKLRRNGESIREIARILKVSKGTASIWCRDINLTKKQIDFLDNRVKPIRYATILKAAQANHQKKLDRIALWEKSGEETIGSVSDRDLLFAGIGLYLGEGRKKELFQFTNSSPELIRVCIRWLQLFNINPSQLNCRIYINEMHRERIVKITEKWSAITGVPTKDFRKPIFIKSKLKKLYENHDTYLGVLSIRSIKSSELFYRILGLMKIFLYNVNGSKKPG